MTIEQQAHMVEKVKRSESFVVENPITIRPDATLEQAKRLMDETHVGGLVVTDAQWSPVGAAHRARCAVYPGS